jgi:RNA polymerase sigma-70 factor (ECF subfamily)
MITLYHVEEISYEEISSVMQLPIGTVKSRLNRARLALRQILEEMGGLEAL